MIYVEDDELFPDMDEEEPIYRSVAAFEPDEIAEPTWDDSKSGQKSYRGTAIDESWLYRSPSDPFEQGYGAPEHLPVSPAVSRGSSSHHDSTTDSARHEPRASHVEEEEDLDDLLRTWAALRVENDKLQAETREMADSARLLATINEEMTATLQVQHGQGRAMGAAPPTPQGSSAAAAPVETVGSLSRPIPGASPPELGNAFKRPRSFTLEYTAEQLHPQKQSSDANGLPQGGAASVGQLRELIGEQRRLRDDLLRESHDNTRELAALQEKNAQLRRQLEQLRLQVNSLRSSDKAASLRISG